MSTFPNTSTDNLRFRNQHGTAVMLNATNYRQWANDVSILLLADRSLKIVEGTELAPQPPVPQSGPATRSAQIDHGDIEAQKQYRKDLRDYEERVNRSISTIYGSISTTMQAYIATMRDPKLMWDILKRQLDTVSARSGSA